MTTPTDDTPDGTPDETPDGTPDEAMTGRDRLARAIKRPSRSQAGVAVLLAVLGFAGAVQIRSTEADDTLSGLRQEDLVQILNGLQAAAQRAENEIAQLEQTQTSLLSNASSRQAAIARAREQAEAFGILAGTLPAVGPGIRIVVTDESGQVGIDELLNAIQELRDAGAEAIELNDAVRVVAQTAFDDGSGAGEPGRVLVDGQEIAQPYVIDAIGDPETLATGLEIIGGFREQVELSGGRVVIETPDVVEIASLAEIATPEFASPVESD